MTHTQAHPVVRHLRALTSAQEHAADDELLGRYVGRADEAAFAALVRRHGGMVLGVCRRLLRHEQDAEDAAQATFLVLARNAAAVRSRSSLAAWLHGVARRVSLKARAARRPATPLTASESAPSAQDPSWREVRGVLDEELDRLPEPLRGPLVLCYLEGLTRDEAAARLGCPLGTLKGRLERGRELLRQRLTWRGLTLSAALAGLALERVGVSAARAASVLGVGAPASARVLELVRGAAPASRLTAGKVALALLAAGALACATVVALPTPAEPPADPTPVKAEKEAPPREEKPRLDAHGDPLPQGAVARLGSLRLFHGTGLRRVVLSPDAKLVVGVDERNANTLWDAVTGKELPLPRELKWTPVFVADGKLLAVMPRPGGPLLDLATGKEVSADGIDTAAERRKAETFGPTFHSPDGKRYATRDEKGFRLFDTATGKELPALENQPDRGPMSVTFSPDGTRLAAPYINPVPTLRVWDLTTRKVIADLRGKDYQIFGTAFSADGKTIAAADGDGVTLWDVGSGKWLHDLGHTYYLSGMVFTPDGRKLITSAGYTDRVIRVWDPLTGKERSRWQGHGLGVQGLAVSPDGRTVASGSQDRTLRLWDVATGKELRRLGEGRETVWTAAFSPDGKLLATGGDAVRVWNVSTGKELRAFGDKVTTRLAFAPDGRLLATVESAGRIVHLWDPQTGKEVRRLTGRGRVLSAPVFAPDGTVFAGDSDGPVHVWDAATGRELRVLGDSPEPRPGGPHALGALAVSPDGRTLATGDSGGVRLWEVASGRERARFTNGHRSSLTALAFSPDGSLLASGGWDRTAVVWDVTGRLTTPRPGAESTPKELIGLWDALADADAVRAYRAVRTLADAGKVAVPFLKEQLRPAAPADAATVERLLKELDSDDFATREAASKGLLRLGEPVEPALRKALTGGPSAEVRRRLEAVLAQLDPFVNGERLRDLRAVEALEGASTVEARDVLRHLAAGDPGARLTREAKAALDRLAASVGE